jgi:cyclopropane fatty-acyl-phospholipid synthase-like methyltransferase
VKSFSEACERNKRPILSVIRPLLSDKNSLLEIGSGNGQHAVYFAQEMPNLEWQTSDRIDNHDEINRWIDDSDCINLLRPIKLDVSRDVWPDCPYDSVYSANTAHIMSWQSVIDCFNCASKVLKEKGVFLLYGPFNYQGKYTSESNRGFDQHLKSTDPVMGIRDFEAISELASDCGLQLQKDYEMPSNNRLLCWQK